MNATDHYRALEKMYVNGAINKIYAPRIRVARGTAEIEIAVGDRFHHAAGAVHGSVYFKMLDDAAFFAAASLVKEVFIVTASFTIYLTRPVTEGIIRSVGNVVSIGRSQFIAESVAYDGRGKEIARGSGVFVRSRIPLDEKVGYIRPAA